MLLRWTRSRIGQMTNAEPDPDDAEILMEGRSGLGTSESIAYRLWLMIELTGRSAEHDATFEVLAERLRREGCAIRPRTIKAHLGGTLVPSQPELDAYGVACEWFEDNALLAEEPERYLKPLIMAELLMCTRIFGMPLSRGRDTPHGLDNMTVAELRAYRAQLVSTGRLELIST